MRRFKPKPGPESLQGSFLLYAAIFLTAFSPCLLFGQAYFDNDLLAQFGPWRAFLKDQLAQGRFPLWNPYNLGGMPFFADLQNMMLYPLNWLTLPFSVPYGLSVFFFLHMFWAAAGMHLWLRSFGLTQAACRVGALLFASSGFFWLEIIHPPVLAAFAWLPWLFLSLEKLSAGLKPKTAFLSGLTFAMLFLCGSFQVALGALYGGLAYFLFRFLKKKGPGPGQGLHSPLAALLFLAWGSLPLWGQLLPTLELSALSDRRLSLTTAGTLDPGLSINPQTLYQVLFPRFSLPEGLSIAEAFQGREGSAQSPEFLAGLGYLGPWIPFLIFFAFRRKEKSIVYFWAFFSLLGLAVSCGTYLPLYGPIQSVLPGLALIRVPYRFLYLFVLGAVVLAAMGFEEWSSAPFQKKNPIERLKGPLYYAFFLYLASLFHPFRDWREAGSLVLGLAGISLICLFPLRKKWGLFILQSALVLPLLLSGWSDFKPGPSSNFDFVFRSSSIPEIGRHIYPFRLLFDSPGLKYPIEFQGKKYVINYPQNAACALGLKNDGGYNPLVLKAKKDLMSLPMGPLLQAGAIRGILVQENRGKIPGFKLEPFPPYWFYASEKNSALAFAPELSTVVPDAASAVSLMRSPDFDLARQLLFSGTLPLDGSAENKPKADLHCDLAREGTDEQDFNLELSRDNWVVFTEMMYPGWKAWVDGTPAPIATADAALRAVYVKAGRHSVAFRLKPDWALPLQLGLILWTLATLGFWFWNPNPSRKPKSA